MAARHRRIGHSSVLPSSSRCHRLLKLGWTLSNPVLPWLRLSDGGSRSRSERQHVWPAIPTFLKLHWGKAIALTVLAAVAGLTLMFLNERAEHFALIERQRQDEISRIGRQQFLAERERARQAKISDCIKQSPTKEAYWTQYAKWHCEAINPQVHSGQIEETVAAIRREQKRSRQSN